MKLQTRNTTYKLAGLALLGLSALTQAQSYHFAINSGTSSVDVGLSGSVDLSGTIIGNYNTTTNPSGTRTKPGLTGTWGTTENDAIPISGVATVSSTGKSALAGSFNFVVDLTTKKVTMTGFSGYAFDSIAGSVIIGLSPKINAFQTKNPTFLFPSINATIPVGPLIYDQVSVVQTATASESTLIPVSTTSYGFILGYKATVTGTVAADGHRKTVSQVLPLLFSGTLSISGKTATVYSHASISGQALPLPVPTALPQFAFSVPTPAGKAGFLGDLSLTGTSLKASVSGTLNATATN